MGGKEEEAFGYRKTPHYVEYAWLSGGIRFGAQGMIYTHLCSASRRHGRVYCMFSSFLLRFSRRFLSDHNSRYALVPGKRGEG